MPSKTDPSSPSPGNAKQAELILRELDALPTLPSVAARLMSITSADDADLREIIRLIEMDPAMTAKVLSLCARASLGVSRQVTTVDRAVVLLGLHAVQAAVLSVQVVDWMGRMGMGPEGAASEAEEPATRRRRAAASAGGPVFDHVGFWRHSIAVACAAELIAREMGGGKDVRPGEAFVAGLMHDLGKPALALALPRAYGRVIELTEQRQGDIAEMERAVIGLDHHTAGKRLAERWGLPDAVRNAMWLHGQRPEAVPEAAHKRLIGVVSLADSLCRRLHLGWSGHFVSGSGAGSVEEQCAALGVAGAAVEGLAPRIIEELAARSEALGLSSQPGDRVLLESVLAANRQLGRLNRTLEQRSRAAAGRGAVLEAIAAFHARAESRRSLEGALAAVAASAAELLGEGFYATICQPSARGEWVVAQYGSDGSLIGTSTPRPPLDDDGEVASLAELATAEGSLAIARWLDDHLGARTRGKNLKQVALGAPGGPPAAVLVHDRVLGQAGWDAAQLGALLATWGAAVSVASELERAESLSEQLAESNRVLVETRTRLAEAESMARLGELTAGAAHEMNNPLAVISGRAQTLAASVRDESARTAAAAIVAASQRLADLITRLHMIATPPRPKPGATSVQDLLATVVREAKERVARGTGGSVGGGARSAMPAVKVVIGGPLPPARVDRDLLRRALVELVVNAIEAGPREGVEVRAAPEDGPEGEMLVITVKDTGPGMDERTLQHALDPFFSRKAAGRQTGLGLPTAKRLVEAHGGTLELRSSPGQGTVATVRLAPGWRWREQGAESGMAA